MPSRVVGRGGGLRKRSSTSSVALYCAGSSRPVADSVYLLFTGPESPLLSSAERGVAPPASALSELDASHPAPRRRSSCGKIGSARRGIPRACDGPTSTASRKQPAITRAMLIYRPGTVPTVLIGACDGGKLETCLWLSDAGTKFRHGQSKDELSTRGRGGAGGERRRVFAQARVRIRRAFPAASAP